VDYISGRDGRAETVDNVRRMMEEHGNGEGTRLGGTPDLLQKHNTTNSIPQGMKG
jgi:hypothetical protein